MKPQQYAKALVGALIAALSALIPVMEDGLTTTEVLTAVVAALVGLSAVFAVPNQAPPGRPADPDLSEQSGLDAGHADVAHLVVMAAIAVIVVTLYHLLIRHA